MDTLAYAVILEPEADGGFSVTVPAFPEIHTQGEDVQDALMMARDAIQLSLSVVEPGRQQRNSSTNRYHRAL